MPRFPPRRRRRMHELVLIEILAVPAERSRGRHNPRVVKRKMSNFPTKARAAPPPGQVFRYEEHVRVVAPAGAPEPRVPTPAAAAPPAGPPGPRARPRAAPPEKPKGRPRQAPARAARRPPRLDHVRSWRDSGLSRAAYCDRHGLDLRAFHHWVARAQPHFRPAAGARSGAS